MIHLVLRYHVPAPFPHRTGPRERNGVGRLQGDTRVLLVRNGRSLSYLTSSSFVSILSRARPHVARRRIRGFHPGCLLAVRTTGTPQQAPCLRVAAAYGRGRPDPIRRTIRATAERLNPPPKSRYSSNSVFLSPPGRDRQPPNFSQFPRQKRRGSSPAGNQAVRRAVKAGSRGKKARPERASSSCILSSRGLFSGGHSTVS